MRIEKIGKSIPHVGKPLWEIVGNLKNFGVGRLIIDSLTLKYSEPSFFKIVKVQPLPSPSKEHFDRNVFVWAEEIYKGKKIEEIVFKNKNEKPNFILIPKHEEEKYLKLAAEYSKKNLNRIVPKYMYWPPLYKKLWEKKNYNKDIPLLMTVISEDPKDMMELSKNEDEFPKPVSNLHKKNVAVEEMIKEIVRLQKIIDSHSSETNT